MKNKKFICKPTLDFHGVKMAIAHFVMQFTHVSRHFGVYSRKQKNSLGRTVLNMWSQIFGSTKLLSEKSANTKKNEKIKP